MKSTILVIDDNADMRENISELLHLAGYEVSTAENGKEGLTKLYERKPDLILCDIMMPKLDGYGVLRVLNSVDELSGIPFIYLTAKSEKQDFRSGMDLGADDYLTKPFEGDELLRVVQARLNKSNSLRKKNGSGVNSILNSGDPASFDELVALTADKTVKKLRPRDMMYMEGDSAAFVYYIISGKIKAVRTNEAGKEYIINIFNDGDIFGYQALLDGSLHRNSAMAIENSEIALIPKQDFFELIQNNSDAAMKFIRRISNTTEETEQRLIKMAYDSARKRVAEALLLLARKYNGNEVDRSSFPGLRENISALAGISPESVSRNLTDFREEGLIDTINGDIVILNRKKLEMLKN